MWYTSLLVAHIWLSELGNSDSMLDMIYSSRALLYTFQLLKKQKNTNTRNNINEKKCFVRLFDLILYVPSTIFQFYRDGYSWVEPVLS